MTLQLSSIAFQHGQPIPNRHTADGVDYSPPLAWTEPPPGVKSWALICDDPDAPRGDWTHWVLFNLPGDATELPEHIPQVAVSPDGARQGKNDFGKLGYNGPAPPRGRPHRYFFRLYGLSSMLDLPAGATKAQLLAAINGRILEETQLMGTYQR